MVWLWFVSHGFLSILNVRVWSLPDQAVNDDQFNWMDFKLDEHICSSHPRHRQTNMTILNHPIWVLRSLNEPFTNEQKHTHTHRNSFSIVQFQCIYFKVEEVNNNEKPKNKMLNCFSKVQIMYSYRSIHSWVAPIAKTPHTNFNSTIKHRGFQTNQMRFWIWKLFFEQARQNVSCNPNEAMKQLIYSIFYHNFNWMWHSNCTKINRNLYLPQK